MRAARPKGLKLEASSFVGTVTVGDLRIDIVPKIRGAPLLHLLRYAYGLRDLHLLPETQHLIEHCSFQELFIAQLADEADESLIPAWAPARVHARGWRRLKARAGRIQFQRLAHSGTTRAALPCRHHPRTENCLINQLLLAGLTARAHSRPTPASESG